MIRTKARVRMTDLRGGRAAVAATIGTSYNTFQPVGRNLTRAPKVPRQQPVKIWAPGPEP
jgi:hypothetical protein